MATAIWRAKTGSTSGVKQTVTARMWTIQENAIDWPVVSSASFPGTSVLGASLVLPQLALASKHYEIEES